MEKLIKDVSAFHNACGVPVADRLGNLTADRLLLRKRLIDEEVNKELLPAMDAGDLVAIADGMADAIYVIVGAALEYGVPLDLIWDAVQKANMAKVDPVTGKVTKREDDKVLKPAGWAPPDIASILAR